MSVLETDVIDYVYLEDDSEIPVIVVSDPLRWAVDEDAEEDHLEALREKLNSQIAFVETGQISSIFPPYDGGPVRVQVIARHALTRVAEEFYFMAKRVMDFVFGSILQSEVPDAMRGRVFTLMDVSWNAMRLVSLALGAIAVEAIGQPILDPTRVERLHRNSIAHHFHADGGKGFRPHGADRKNGAIPVIIF